jgi:flavin reductase (DIM6/NTAB) family NADH-FMN oxidoreductase RutF
MSTAQETDVHTAAPPADIADAAALRRAFAAFPTGVTVVTTGGATPHAMTANSFTSVSLDPPLVLVCVDLDAVMHRALLSAGEFGVSVLAAGQEAVARRFADRRRPLGRAQFDGVGWVPGRRTAAPMIDGAIAHFECGLWRSYEGGDHTIFVGRLLSLARRPADALLFTQGRLLPVRPEEAGS